MTNIPLQAKYTILLYPRQTHNNATVHKHIVQIQLNVVVSWNLCLRIVNNFHWNNSKKKQNA